MLLSVHPGTFCELESCGNLHVGLCCLRQDSTSTVTVNEADPPPANAEMKALSAAFAPVLGRIGGAYKQPLDATRATRCFDARHCHPLSTVDVACCCQSCGLEANTAVLVCRPCNFFLHQLCRQTITPFGEAHIPTPLRQELAPRFRTERRPTGSTVTHAKLHKHALTLKERANVGGAYVCDKCKQVGGGEGETQGAQWEGREVQGGWRTRTDLDACTWMGRG